MKEYLETNHEEPKEEAIALDQTHETPIQGDIIQEHKKMTKDSRDNSHSEQSSQQTSQDPTKDPTNLIRRRTRHTPEHQLFFLLVFLKIKTCCK